MTFQRIKHPFDPFIKKRLILLRELDNWHGFIAIAYDFLVISLAISLFLLNHWLYPVSIILIGSRQRALATLLHESAHRCLIKSPFWNWFAGTYLSGYLIFQEYNAYADSHVKKHHGFLGDKHRDPDLIYHNEQGLYKSTNRRYFFYQFIIKPLLLLKSFSYLEYLIKNRFKPSKKYRKQFFSMMFYWAVIIAACYYFGVINLLIFLWFIPLITTSAVFGWFNELSEHYPMLPPDQSIDIQMSRNRFSHWIEHFLCNTHNENYHLIHHLYPNIPFWNLPKAHLILSEDKLYAKINEKAGGIVWSKNGNTSLIQSLYRRNNLNGIYEEQTK